MKRSIIGQVGLFSLLASLGAGCAAEQTTHELESDQTAEGARMVGIGSDGEELPTAMSSSDRPIQRRLSDPTKSSCPGCGPVPDPWKSIVGPVPDPWQTKSPPDPPGKNVSGTPSSDGSNRKP